MSTLPIGTTALPWLPLSCAILVQISECLLLEVLFPFLAFMVEDFGYNNIEIGFYTGLLASCFCSAQFCTSILWGMISDRYGRRISIIAGLIGGMIGNIVLIY